jgi:hypothetical protein
MTMNQPPKMQPLGNSRTPYGHINPAAANQQQHGDRKKVSGNLGIKALFENKPVTSRCGCRSHITATGESLLTMIHSCSCVRWSMFAANANHNSS